MTQDYRQTKLLIIPDVHGRGFWREPVAEALGKTPIVFLGDYVDPYAYEGIAPWAALGGFEELVEMKRSHPDDVILLLGNHDLQYLTPLLLSGRNDFENADKIKALIENNAGLFQLTYVIEAGGRRFLFSHAGIKSGWLLQYREIFEGTNGLATATVLNVMWEQEQYRDALYTILSDVSYSRLGDKPYGSPVWNDVDNMAKYAPELSGWYQIFGHSQQEADPVIKEHFACLDCRRAFWLTEEGKIAEYKKE